MLCVMGTIQSGNIFFNAGTPRDPNAIPVEPKVIRVAKFITKLPKRSMIPAFLVALAYGQCMEENKNTNTNVNPHDVYNKLWNIFGDAWNGGTVLAIAVKEKVKQNLPAEALAIWEKKEAKKTNLAQTPPAGPKAPSTLPGDSTSASSAPAAPSSLDGQSNRNSDNTESKL